MRAQQQPAYVLHPRPYGETSLLVELFTRQHGRIGSIAKGARRPKSRLRAVIHPFQRLRVNWSGRGELMALSAAEPDGAMVDLRGQALYCGLYLNELLMRLLHRHDPHEDLFDRYQQCLQGLVSEQDPNISLRIFEKHLLQELGYGLILDREVGGNSPIEAESVYDYLPERGALPADQADGQGVQIHGASLQALEREVFSEARSLGEIKVLMRRCLAHYLGPRPLYSRRLFQQAQAAHADAVSTREEQ